jgi:hypothetical protein
MIVTLAYTVQLISPNLTTAQLSALLAAVDVDKQAIQDITGCTLVSDTTTGLTRTFVYDLTAQFISEFPATSDQAAPFRDLYTHTLAAQLQSMITAAAPVIS